MVYKNYSCTAKTFYGVTLKPGETKEIDGVINNRWVLPVTKLSINNVKTEQQKPSSELQSEISTTQSTSAKEDAPKLADSTSSKEEPAKLEVKPEEKQNKVKKS